MFDEFLKKAEELRHQNEPFATAVVVRRKAPSSGKTGDKAIINQYGEIFGWIGGGCTKSIILKEAETALKEGKPRLVRVTPEEEETTEGVTSYKMTCYSGGAVDVYIEPVLPRPHLVLLGKSAIAQSLARLARAMDYKVTAVAPGADLNTFGKVDELHTKLDLAPVRFSGQTFVVVATQGEQDEQAIMEALKKAAPYIAFVSSRKKWDVIRSFLADSGFNDDQLAAIQSPAGLNINAKLPEEVAISILAEIIQINRSREFAFRPAEEKNQAVPQPSLYINPVCGIPVDRATAKYVLEFEGEKIYFCCDGCKAQFEENPAKYMVKQG